MTKKQFGESTEKIQKIKKEQDFEINEILDSLKTLLNAETIVKRAENFEGGF